MWSGVISELLRLEANETIEGVYKKIRWMFASQPEKLDFLPLLNAVLALELPDTTQSKSLTGESRAAYFEDLLCYLIESEANLKQPIVIQLDDVHRYYTCDSFLNFCRITDSSFRILELLLRRPSRVLFIMSSRLPLIEKFANLKDLKTVKPILSCINIRRSS